MKIKKIVAPTMKDALIQIKKELGEDAIILKSQKIPKGGIFSFIAGEQIEVTAAIDPDFNAPGTNTNNNPAPPPSALKNASLKEKYLLYDIRDEVENIQNTLNEIGQQLKFDLIPGLPKDLAEIYITLVNNGVEKEIAGKMVAEVFTQLSGEALQNPALVGMEIQKRLRKMFPVSAPLILESPKSNILALIGPTGVGKTTTIAKIATQFKFFFQKKVALISADTYRMAAVEQLRTFARISALPLEVVYTPDEMKPAILKHQDKDLIIIDTAGRSHRDNAKMKELGAHMEAAQPDQVHLTLSASTKLSDLLDIVDRFRIVASDYFLFTKLDETTDFGNILNLVYYRQKPISYLTLGQSVPDDIALADSAGLARLMLSHSLEEAIIPKGINVRSSAKTERARSH